MVTHGATLLSDQPGVCNEKSNETTRYNLDGITVKQISATAGWIEFKSCNEIFEAEGKLKYDIQNEPVTLEGDIACKCEGATFMTLVFTIG